MEKLIEVGGKEKVESLKCANCGAEIVYRYESGQYDVICCSVECLGEMEDHVEFGLEFGFDD